MQKTPFVFKQLSIYKMPGFPKGLPAYRDLSPGINIIAGANASGKSSTARVIQELIWKRRESDIQAEASAEADSDFWEIRLDSGRLRTQRNGRDEQILGLPPAEGGDRYMLALQDLVREDEQGLAKHIVQESIGGYDLDLAEANLEYSCNVKSKACSEYKQLERAEQHYKQLLQQQRDLKKQEERLQGLYVQKQNSQKAFTEKDLYQRVVEFLEATHRHDAIKQEFDSYPVVMEKVSGEEFEQIRELERDIQDAEEAEKNAQEELDRCRKELQDLNLPEEGIDRKVLFQLDRKIEELADLEQQIREQEQRIRELTVRSDSAVKHIKESLDPRDWEGIDLQDIGRLEDFLLNAHQVITEKQFLETEINELQQEIENRDSVSSDLAKHGIRTLSEWLREQEKVPGIPVRWLGILSLLGCIAVILPFVAGWPGLLGILLLIVPAIYFYVKGEDKQDADLRKQDYIKTGLRQPEEWSVQEICEILSWLQEKMQDAKSREKTEQRLAERQKELDNLQGRLDQLHETYSQWLDRLQAAPDLPEQDLKNYSALYSFLVDVKNWQQANADLEAGRARKQELSREYGIKLQQINDLFQGFCDHLAGESSEARGIYSNLQNLESSRRENAREIERQQENIQKSKQDKAKYQDKLSSLYQKLDLAFGNREEVKGLVEQLEGYQKAREEYRFAKSKLAEKRDLMQEHSMYEACSEDIAFLTLDQAREKVRELEELSGKLEGINREIAEIETKISNAEKNNQLEEALMNKESALDALQGLYKANLSSITGKSILDRLKKETREQNRPGLFKRANRIFNLVTSGRYELDLQEEGVFAFRAYDTVLKLGQDLEELSTGTRIQLLLSVRLAFIENREPSLKLPVIADEVLANSDDTRAKAIIDALIEISKQGRQVFYLTAQGDEVGKWKTYLDSNQDVDFKIVELIGRQNESIRIQENNPGFGSLELGRKGLPDPSQTGHAEYGELLQVPGFDILTQDAEQLHLWYLLEDTRLLHTCLASNLNYWGQLDSFFKNNGELQGFDRDTIQGLRDRVKLLERFQELYKKGRSIRIDRDVLEQSGAVSEKFIDAVDNKLQDLDRDPARLVQALKNGEVQGFRKNKIRDLEQYLLDQGYMDAQAKHEKEDILVQLNALLSRMQIQRQQAERFIQGMLGQD